MEWNTTAESNESFNDGRMKKSPGKRNQSGHGVRIGSGGRNLKAIFKRYDEGCIISPAMEYSITREDEAHRKACRARILLDRSINTVIDCCGGGGGDTIGFTRQGFDVYYIDISPENMAAAKQNCKVYCCDTFVQQFVCGDMLDLDLYQKLQPSIDFENTLLHVSPEWGGPEYLNTAVFDLEHTNPPVPDILEVFESLEFGALSMWLPRTSNIDQLREWGCTQIDYFHRGRNLTAICAWWLPPDDQDWGANGGDFHSFD